MANHRISKTCYDSLNTAQDNKKNRMNLLKPVIKTTNLHILFMCSILLIVSQVYAQGPNPLNITGPDPVCEGSLEAYTADLVAGTYNWHIINGTGNNSTTNSVNIMWGNAGIGTITIYITDSSGDTTTVSTVDVTIEPKPQPVITTDFNSACLIWIPGEGHGQNNQLQLVPDTCFKACDTSYVKYMVNDVGSSTWQWFVTGAISYTINGNEIEVLWGAPGMGWVKVVETTAAGCTDSTEHCVRIIERPQAVFTSDPAAVNGLITICHGQTIYFTDLSTGTSESPIMNWYWDFGDGFTSTDPDPSHTYQDPGNYTVSLIVTNMCNCHDTITVDVYVDETSAPIIECAGTVCAGDTVQYISPSNCSVYNWVVSGGSIISGGASNNNFVIVVWGSGTNGVGTVSLATPNCADYCEIPNILHIPIVSNNINIIGPATVCMWSQVQYQVPLMPGTVYNWSASGGAIIANGQGTNTVFIDVIDTDFDLYVEYYNSFLDCGGNDTLEVTVKPEFSVEGPINGCEGDNFIFNATTSPSNNYTWKILNVNTNAIVSGPTNGSGIYNINWTFGHGNFIVYATNLSGLYCNTTESIYLEIFPAPPLPVTASGEIYICPEQAYEYTAEPTDPNYFIQWQITGGSPSSATGNIISVLWDATGPYKVSVSQVSKNEPYCESAYVDLDVYVNSPPTPLPTDISGDDEVCTNSTTIYTTTLLAQNYTWHVLGPNSTPTTPTNHSGSIISGQGTNTITVLWHNSPGQAIVRLVLKNCTLENSRDYLVDVVGVTLPVINGPSTACSGENIIFNQHNISTATAWSWDFGDPASGANNTSSLQYPDHTFTNYTNDPITFNITFQVIDPDGCVGVYTANQTINVYPQPLAVITFQGKLVYCPQENINTIFYVPQNSLYSYQWYKDGVAISGATTSTYTANTTGTYHAVVTNTYGCTSTSSQRTITVLTSCGPGPPCTASGESVTLTYAIGPGCTDVTFTATTTPNNIATTSITYFSGDDPAGSLIDTYTYPAPGYYNANVVVEYAGYCNETDGIQVHIPIMADFQVEFECFDENEFTVNFIDLSTYVPDAINDWDWEIYQNSVLIYTINNTQFPSYNLTPGTYDVILKIKNTNNDQCQITKQIIVPQPPVANFTSDSSKCEQTPTMHFTNQSQGDIIGWLWDFGDNAGSLLEDPDRTYNAGGTFPVTLTVTDKYGCTSTEQKFVTVNYNVINGSILPPYLGICNGDNDMLIFDNGPPFSNITSYLWSNSATTSSISVSQTGNYTVTVTDDQGCSFTTAPAVVQVQHIPYPLITGKYEYCEGDTIKLNANQGNMYTYTWSFNNAPVLPLPITPHLLELTGIGAGSYLVEVVLSDGTGCINSATVTITVHPKPTAPLLTFSSNPLCENEPILVSVTNNPGLLHNWSTGQSGSSITVTNSGLYAVTVTNTAGCTNTRTFEVHPLPNTDWWISGCYDFCDTIPITLPGSTEYYEAWQLYINGIPDPNYAGGGNIPPGSLGTLNPGTYVIQYQITSVHGCEVWTEPLEITIKQCPCECLSIEYGETQCYFTDAYGVQYYLWEVQINFGCAENGSFTVYSPNGEITLYSSTNLTNGPNFISGVFKDTDPAGNIMCLNFSVTYPEGVCDFQSCIELPDCPSVQCNFDIEVGEIRCIGLNNMGQYIYSFAFDLNSPGNYDILITSLQGSVIFSPTQVISGNNSISGTFTNVSGANNFCFYISAYNPESGQTCYFVFCIDGLPECECVTEINICKIVCAGFDPYTQDPIYYFEACLNSPLQQNVYISTAYGIISNQSQIQVPSGSSIISGFYTNNSGAGSVCFDFQFVYTVNDITKDYICNVCTTLPECESIDSCSQTSVTISDIICAGTDNSGNPLYTVNFNITSPPAGSVVHITSNTGIIGNINSTGTTATYSYINPGLVACFTFTFVYPTGICKVSLCDTLPNCCSSIPIADSCNVSATEEWIYCLGTDSYGNQIYMFEASVVISGSYLIFPYTTEGSVYFPVMQLSNGNNLLSGIFSDSPPYNYSTVSIIINVWDQVTLTTCYFTLNFDLSELCDPFEPSEFYRTMSISSSNSLILKPNPAGESTEIVYKFEEGKDNIVFILDMQGRTLQSFENLGTEGTLVYSTDNLPDGVYFVVAQSRNNVRLAEKLVISK